MSLILFLVHKIEIPSGALKLVESKLKDETMT